MSNKVNSNDIDIGFIKIAYFDEEAAQDYLDIYNGGRKETTDMKIIELQLHLRVM